MNRYDELTNAQRQQIDLLINALASEPDKHPVDAMRQWINRAQDELHALVARFSDRAGLELKEQTDD
jgi:Spy/CpxP family protein refolding chaperone